MPPKPAVSSLHAAVADDGVVLRPMTADDLPQAHALSAEQRWPHRPVDWEQMFAHSEGLVAERDGKVVATAQRWLWGDHHATIGLVIVSPACQGRRIGHRLMSALLEDMDDRTVLLQATAEGRGLYERLGSHVDRERGGVQVQRFMPVLHNPLRGTSQTLRSSGGGMRWPGPARPAPSARAASTNSFSRSEKNCARTSRATIRSGSMSSPAISEEPSDRPKVSPASNSRRSISLSRSALRWARICAPKA